jgi:hypothetical protein
LAGVAGKHRLLALCCLLSPYSVQLACGRILTILLRVCAMIALSSVGSTYLGVAVPTILRTSRCEGM